jgi:hypothetical protein
MFLFCSLWAEGIITLTKHPPELASATAARNMRESQAAGAPDVASLCKDEVVSAASRILLEYFNERYGQGAPVTLEEATLVANLLWRAVQGRVP